MTNSKFFDSQQIVIHLAFGRATSYKAAAPTVGLGSSRGVQQAQDRLCRPSFGLLPLGSLKKAVKAVASTIFDLFYRPLLGPDRALRELQFEPS